MSSFYQYLKKLYWPVVIFRMALVLSVILILLYLFISILTGFAVIVIILALSASLILGFIATIFSMISGSLIPRKLASTLSRRNRTVQISLLAIAINAILAQEFQALHPAAYYFIGVLQLLGVSYFFMYLSHLAVDGMYFEDHIENEANSDLYVRRAIYMPPIFIRDFLFPIIVIFIGIYINFNETACTGIIIYSHITEHLAQFNEKYFPTQLSFIFNILIDEVWQLIEKPAVYILEHSIVSSAHSNLQPACQIQD